MSTRNWLRFDAFRWGLPHKEDDQRLSERPDVGGSSRRVRPTKVPLRPRPRLAGSEPHSLQPSAHCDPPRARTSPYWESIRSAWLFERGLRRFSPPLQKPKQKMGQEQSPNVAERRLTPSKPWRRVSGSGRRQAQKCRRRRPDRAAGHRSPGEPAGPGGSPDGSRNRPPPGRCRLRPGGRPG